MYNTFFQEGTKNCLGGLRPPWLRAWARGSVIAHPCPKACSVYAGSAKRLLLAFEFFYNRATQLADRGPNLDLFMVKSGPRQLLKVVFYTQKCLSQNLAILPVILSH